MPLLRRCVGLASTTPADIGEQEGRARSPGSGVMLRVSSWYDAGAARLSARRKRLPRQRMRLTAQVLEVGTHTHSHTVSTVSPGMGPRRPDTFRAEIYSSLHIRTVL